MANKDFLSDDGLVFIQENGQLHSLTNENRQIKVNVSQTRSFTLCKPKSDNDSTTSDTINTYKVPSLMSICIDLVAHNLALVESLDGFPEIVGHSIYDVALKRDLFSEINTSVVQSLSLFIYAYGDYMFKCVNMRDCQLLCAELGDLSGALFLNVTKLDLSGCRLGDGHDMIAELSHLTRLESLNMEENELSNHGVRKLTTPMRVLGKGLTHLRYLNLSGNRLITDACLLYLFRMKMLQCLDISGCSTTSRGIDQICGKLHLERSSTKEFEDVYSTSGWAACILEKWKEVYNRRKPIKAKRNTDFYGRKAKTSSANNQDGHKVMGVSQQVIVLRHVQCSNKDNITTVLKTSTNHRTKHKRKPKWKGTSTVLQMKNGQSGEENPPKKQKISQEDLDLALSYM